jgi:hypothetical protein
MIDYPLGYDMRDPIDRKEVEVKLNPKIEWEYRKRCKCEEPVVPKHEIVCLKCKGYIL